MVKSIKKVIDRTLEWITGTLFLVMVAVTMWQVISRYILNSPSSVTEEFLKFALIWLSMLSAAYVVGKKKHIAFTLLSDRFKDNKKLSIDIVIQTGFLFFSGIIMLYGGARAISITMAQLSPSLHLPMGLVYLSLPVSGALGLFYSIQNIIELFSEKKEVFTNSEDQLPEERVV
jgi:TRAP-type C4-dicarboxylate transport system permease small subunit